MNDLIQSRFPILVNYLQYPKGTIYQKREQAKILEIGECRSESCVDSKTGCCVWHDRAVWYKQCKAVQNCAKLYKTVQNSAKLCKTVQGSAKQCKAVQNTEQSKTRVWLWQNLSLPKQCKVPLCDQIKAHLCFLFVSLFLYFFDVCDISCRRELHSINPVRQNSPQCYH